MADDINAGSDDSSSWNLEQAIQRDVGPGGDLADEDRRAALLRSNGGTSYDLDELDEHDMAHLVEQLVKAQADFAFESSGDLVVDARSTEKADEIIATLYGPEDDSDVEVVYDVGDLEPAERTTLIDRLTALGVETEWQEDGDLIVGASDADSVDRVLDDIENA